WYFSQWFIFFVFLSFSVEAAEKDIVFLLDGSDSTRNGFPAMRDFVENRLSVDDNKDRVSVVQYSRDPAVQFYLNRYTNKSGRPLNTGAALQYVKDNVFTASAGSRRLEGVPQVLILLSGGRSSDSVDAPASALKQLGVLTFTIGTKRSDMKYKAFSIFVFKMRWWYSFILFRIGKGHARCCLKIIHYSMISILVLFAKLFYFMSSCHFSVYTAKKDVVFLLDGSDSTRNGFPAMRNFIEKVVEELNVGENKDRVSVVQYSKDAEVHFYLNTYTKTKDIVDLVRGLRHRGGRPLNTGAALQFVSDTVFTNPAGSRRRQGVPQILILLNGGRSFDIVDTSASVLRQQGIIVIGIGTRSSDSGELQKISYDPNYTLSVSEFTDLPSVQEKLYSLISTGGNCKILQPKGKDDIVFLLDGSDSTRNGFPAMRDFVENVVEKLNVGESKDRVSVVQYSRDSEVNFYLNTYTTKEDIVDSVKGLRHKGGRPLNTGAALQYVRDNVFTNPAGSRHLQGVPQILILLNGGRSFDNVDTPASVLKQQGIIVIGIGTRSSDSGELRKITQDPNYTLSVSEFTDLPSVQEQLSSILVLFAKLFYFMSSCHFSVYTAKKDVVFLLDGSDSTRNGFPAMRNFIEKVVEELNVGENKDRVSVVQYSKDAEVHFYLNTYTKTKDIVDLVRGLRHRGGRPLNTGAALQFVSDTVFTNPAGSRRRQGVPQILILLNGGKSFDNVGTPASVLRQQGIIVIGIGTRSSDSGELRKITQDPNYTLSVSEFTDLPSVQEQLSDVVFLLDGSDGTRTGFPAMQDFVQRVVERLSVDDNKDRVSVVQYSRDPAVQFYLNRYANKSEILDTIRGLRHKGGRPLNTGAALQYLRDNVFTPSAGSRRLEGVQQVLILLNGEGSSDSVDAAASALKQLGVLTFAIGTRSSDSRELQKISHNANSTLYVILVLFAKLFYFLSSCLYLVEAAEKDIVFLLDGSNSTRNVFPAMRDFVEKVVEKLNVGENKDRVSVVQYSEDAEAHFYLKTYITRKDIVDSIRGLRHRGGSPLNTGSALQYVRDNVFTNSSGSRHRQGVPQILILLKGGRSFDNVDTPAFALKQQGIFVIGIGTNSSDSGELQTISYEPNCTLLVSEFTNLQSVQDQLSSLMMVTKPKGRDVVFLLDGSNGTRTGFPAMQDFVQRVVERLSVDDNKDRVSVVQYSRDPAVQFYLNTYATKVEILDIVRGLRHKGGRPLNTGAALQYLRDNVFTASAGSRRLEGVPQVLILLSGGRSSDSVDESAAALKQLGVLTFAIGTRSSDSRELQKISHNGDSALSVSDFTDLQRIQQQLQSSLEAVVIDVTPESPTVLASVLKQQGIIVIGIGTRSSDSGELRKITQDPNYTLSVSEFTDLPSVQEQLSSLMSTALVRATPMTPTVTGKKETEFTF
uniref:Collagen, type VI, alpha 3 n=1 Tax=Cyclopterus lumpus TaxID=8103 RepID=A0A8C3ADS5_CYCLU